MKHQKYIQNIPLVIKSLLLVIFFILHGRCSAQTTALKASSNSVNDSVITWLHDLYERGVNVGEDSISVSKESQMLINDNNYRRLIYPKAYTWETTIAFIQKQELKKAFWYMINLYSINDQNKELVIKSILIYDKILKMDKALISAYYTYSLMDPEIGKIENNHSEVTAPHIMEKKLNSLKEMLYYVSKYESTVKKVGNSSNIRK